MIPLLFQLRDVCSQEASDKSSVVGPATIMAPYYKRWTVCVVTRVRRNEYSVATHPVSVLCRAGYCRYHQCSCRQSVDACSHSVVVRADGAASSRAVSKHIWGELLNFRHGSARITKGRSKEKVQHCSSQGQILSSTGLDTFWFFGKSSGVSVWDDSKVIFRVMVLIPRLLALASRCSICCNPLHRHHNALIYEAATHNTRINMNPRNGYITLV